MKTTKASIGKYEVGMAGFLSLILIALLTLEKLDTALKVTVVAIAVTLPFLISSVMIGNDQKRWEKLKENYRYFIVGFNLIGSVTSLTAVFWHFLPIAGVLFVFIVLLCLFTMFRSTTETKNKE